MFSFWSFLKLVTGRKGDVRIGVDITISALHRMEKLVSCSMVNTSRKERSAIVTTAESQYI